jgi:hypothetical protein
MMRRTACISAFSGCFSSRMNSSTVLAPAFDGLALPRCENERADDREVTPLLNWPPATLLGADDGFEARPPELTPDRVQPLSAFLRPRA